MSRRIISMSTCVLILLAACTAWGAPAVPGSKVHFRKITLDHEFRSEGVAVGDFNHDGKLDIAAGNVYYAPPDWKMIPMGDKPRAFNPKKYSDSFINCAMDVNGDGWTDLVVVGFPGQQTWWLENPGKSGGIWQRHLVAPVTNNESAQFVDLDGHGRRTLLCGVSSNVAQPDGPTRRMAFLRPGSDPTLPWQVQPISAPGAPNTNRFGHGLGFGDINGDGRNDVVVPQGWWESPAKTDGPWKFHPAPLGDLCAQMVVYDFDGDGKNDVVTSSAHNYGLWYHKQTADGWKTTLIDRSFSQSHSLCLADINGDGLPDLVTGKRWWAHIVHDPGINEPAVLYWYETTRVNGQVSWIRHLIDNDSGVGTQFEVTDVNGDGLPDIVVANKKGVFLFLQYRD